MITPLSNRLQVLGQGYRSAFIPSEIAGLTAWFDAGTLNLADTAAVASWNDRAGIVPNATQATAANQPVFRTNIVNGLPVVRYTTAKWMSFVSSALQLSSKTVFVACALDTAPTSVRAFVSAAAANWYAGIAASSQQLFSGANAAVPSVQRTYFSPAAAFSVGSWGIHVYHITVAGSNVTRAHYKNGALLGSSLLTDGYGPVTAVTWYLGSFAGNGTSGWPGDIAEILVYNSALSTTDRQRVEQYLSAKYAIGLTV